jgi:hypothetical protein
MSMTDNPLLPDGADFDPIPAAFRDTGSDDSGVDVDAIGKAIEDALALRKIPLEAPADESDPTASDPTDAPEGAQDAPAEGGPGGAGQPDAAPTPAADDPADAGSAPADPEPAPVPPHRLSVPIPGTEHVFDLDVDTAQGLLALAAWNENLAPQTREQFAAIETGAAVAVAKADYERFQAWLRTEGADYQPDADLDPAVAQRIAALEAQLAQVQAQPQAQALLSSADRAEQAFRSTMVAYAQEKGLTADEVQALVDHASASGVIPVIADQLTTYSPTGQRIVEPDYARVARQSLDFALVQNPALHTRTLAPQAPAAADPGPDPTAIKKARAGALASAPSAAVTPPPLDPRTASPEVLRAAMAAEIRAAQAGGQ